MRYAKSLAALGGVVVAAIVAALAGDNYIDSVELVELLILGIGGVGTVFAAPNVRYAHITKFVVYVIMAVLTLAVSLVTGGISVTEWLMLLAAALTAVAVYSVPNSHSEARHAA